MSREEENECGLCGVLDERKSGGSMKKTPIGPGDWVVVCDGRKWLILENAGDERLLNLKAREERQAENPATHLQGTDRPGRTHQSTGAARSAVSQTDWHDEAERAFLKSLAKRINDAALRRETNALILVAPPRALGMIRPELSPAAVKILRAEIDKDYVALPIYEIEKRILA
jgi:protein required for attachment to host cells